MLDSHQSGHATATVAQTSAALGALIARKVSLGAWTEARDNFEPPPGWGRTPGETAIFWHEAEWRLRGHNVESVMTNTWRRGSARRKTWDWSWAVLEHRKTQELVLRCAGHHPAHLFIPAQRRAAGTALDALPDELRYVAAGWDGLDVVTYSADFNLDLRLERNRRRVTPPGYRLLVPPAATMLSRRIDGVLTNGRTNGPWMVKRARGLDHRGFVFWANPR